ncbi:MAG: hypothetical protein WBH03_21395 [Cyclobacteriaceae bacterium]
MSTPTQTSEKATVKFFGRDPALFIAAVEATLLILVTFNLGVDSTTSAAIMAVVVAGSALAVAYFTDEPLLAGLVGVIKAGAALLIVLGVDLTQDQVAAIVGVAPIVIGMWQRGQATPQQGFALAA